MFFLFFVRVFVSLYVLVEGVAILKLIHDSDLALKIPIVQSF